MKYDHYKTEHGRRSRKYDKGETVPQYGLARRTLSGELIFVTEESFSMGWSDDKAATWTSPPHHYLKPGLFMINFRKKSSPVILGERTNKSNRRIIAFKENK